MRRPGGNQIFFIFLFIMLISAFQSGQFTDPSWWQNTLLLLPGIIIGLTFHEFAHAWSAWKLGDQTPKLQGRVNLNPISHIDPLGIIILIFAGFGWGRPVQINPYGFRGNRRVAGLIVSVAGVATNFVLAFLFFGLLFAIAVSGAPQAAVLDVVEYIVYINIVLMVFNLLPIPPLDGFGILTELFDLRRFSWYQPLYNNGFFILLGLIVVGRVTNLNLIWILISSALGSLYSLFYSVWGAIIL